MIRPLCRVSVPYRGATFLNWEEVRKAYWIKKTVSVPYRGATFLNGTSAGER